MVLTASPRFGGPPFVFILTRPPHNVGWWKVDVLTGDPKKETGRLRLGTVKAQAYCLFNISIVIHIILLHLHDVLSTVPTLTKMI